MNKLFNSLKVINNIKILKFLFELNNRKPDFIASYSKIPGGVVHIHCLYYERS